MRFWKREDELEGRLRSSRPEARSEFVRELGGRLEGAPRPRAMRFALAATLTAVALAVFGGFGGLSYAGKAVKFGSDESASHSQRGNDSQRANSQSSNNSDEDDEEGDEEGEDDDDPTDDQYGGKTTICHSTSSATNPFVLISVSNNAIPAHKRHGDTLPGPGGTCPGPPIP